MVAKKELLRKKLTEKRMEILLQIIEEEVNAAWGEVELLKEQDYGDDYGGDDMSSVYGAYGGGGGSSGESSQGYTGARRLIDPKNLIGTLLSPVVGTANAIAHGVTKMGVQLIGMAGMLIGGTLSGLLPFNSNVGRNITKYFHSWEKKNLRGIDQQFSQELAEINRGWETFREDFWGIGFIASPMNAIAAALVAEKSLDIGMSALNVVTGGAAQHALENFLNSPEIFDTRSRNSYYYNEATELPNKVPEDLPSQLKMLEKVKKEKPELVKKFLDDLVKNPELKAEETKWVDKNLPPAMTGIVKDMNDAITSGKVGAVTPQEIAAYKSQVGDIIKKTFEGASKEGKFKVEPPSSALDKTIAAVESVTKSMPAAQEKPTPPVATQAQSASQQKPASQSK
jgi:hypothetical protein